MRLTISALVLFAVSSCVAAIGDETHLAAGGLQVRKHHHHHHHHHHHKHKHHKAPTQPDGHTHRPSHKKPDAIDSEPPSRHHHSTTTHHHHHHHSTTSTRAKPTSTKAKPTASKTTSTAKGSPAPTHKYGLIHSDKIRGVNLGNWLVIESWMDSRITTALNKIAVHAPASVVKQTKGKPIVDEYTTGLYADKANASALLMQHFDEWMQEKDWRRIAEYGLNTVRIPVPHYAFPDCIEKGAPFLSLNRLDKLKEGVLMAKKYNLKVWLSLHSTPGSQNGYDSSGRVGPAQWATSDEYVTLTKKAFNHLVDIFSQPPYAGSILAIEPVNEPTAAQDPDILSTLKTYYPLAYNVVSNNAQQKKVSLIGNTATPQMRFAAHDGWKGIKYWSEPTPFFDAGAREEMFFSLHAYWIFGDYVKNQTDSQRVASVCKYGQKIANFSSVYTIVTSECSIGAPRGDNGWGRDMHQADHLQFDNPALDYPFSDEYMRFLALNFRAQQQAFERGAGWMLWTWKNYGGRSWSYKSGVRYGWLPRNAAELDQQPFGNLCPGW
ncbi:hypothetical protein OC845_003511 [Tilletia horrida]|nr:hypothetical protein OC845_003511 [Tilletia horrida]